jgi:lactoylglutathione lyase
MHVLREVRGRRSGRALPQLRWRAGRETATSCRQAREESAFDEARLQATRLRIRMKIEHLALWTDDVERLAAFYQRYFGATVAAPYVNDRKGFESRFVSFESGARRELMRTTVLSPIRHEAGTQRMGLTHFAISLGSEQGVDALTEQLRQDGHTILDGPRRTGDGYYESVVLDPDGNRVEIVA